MNKKLILVACMALIIAGCGDKDDAASGSAEPTMMDKASDATSDTMDATGEMAAEAGAAVRETAGDAAEGTSEMASDAGDAVKSTVHDAAEGVADATADDAAEAAGAAGVAVPDTGTIPSR
jgi:hypothetical protein